jgi:hypothetical protein
VGGGRGLLLGVVVLAPEAAAWQGLLALARDTFHMDGHLAYLVPLLFGAAAFYVALLAQRYVLRGDSAMTERVFTWLYAAAGAGFNFWHADHVQHEPAAALFFGGASLSAALLWDRTLRAWRRDQLREIGALERPLPRFRALRWVLAPVVTFRAFRLSVMRGLSTPDEALALVEAETERKRAARIEAAELARAAERANAVPAADLEERPAAELVAALAPSADVPAVADEPAVDASAAAGTGSEARDIPVVPEAPVDWNKAAAAREALEALGLDLDVDTPTTEQLTLVATKLSGPDRAVTAKYVREVARRQRIAADKRAESRPVRLVAGAR